MTDRRLTANNDPCRDVKCDLCPIFGLRAGHALGVPSETRSVMSLRVRAAHASEVLSGRGGATSKSVAAVLAARAYASSLGIDLDARPRVVAERVRRG